ncbi:unnamed protein product, partial [Medioppia subpectinata]
MTQEMTPIKGSLVTTDDGEVVIKKQRRIYAKNSFDRFGDDLCGLILSYLLFDERFGCECVSKQFQRTVFESVVHITIDDNYVNTRANIQMLAAIVRKCSHIHTIDCRKITNRYTKQLPEALAIFRDNCPHLRHIYCDLNKYTDQLMPEFGLMVTRIGWIENRNDQRLSQCHRLSQLQVNDISKVFSTGELLAKNLQRFEFSYNSGDNRQLLSPFVTGNQSLRSVKLDVCNYESHESLTEVTEQLSRLPQLRDLALDLTLNYGPNSLDVFLRPIGQKCPQLKRLGLKLESKNTIRLYNHSMDSLGCYRRLKHLDLTIISAIFEQFLDPLKLCHRLTHLSLNSSQINDNLFVNCDKHWPRLQCLSIERTDITSNGLDHISRLPALQTLEFDCFRLFSGFVISYKEMTPTKRLRVTTEDTEDEDIQQPQMCPKKSFNRFGDDLCGLILSYLSLDDRFVCECVSTQFQRTVFESVVDITLHDQSMRSRANVNDMKMLATISRKCPHIHTIDIRRISIRYTKELSEVLAIFRDNCRHLRNIYCYLDLNTVKMMPEFGPMVTRIGGIGNCQKGNQRLSHVLRLAGHQVNDIPRVDIRQLLNHCHRLSRLRIHTLFDVFDDTFDEPFVKNLQTIEFYNEISNTNQQLSAFVDKNQSLRSVKLIDNRYQTHDSLTEMAEQLSRLPQLRHLELNLRTMSDQNSLNESLRTIGQKCRQLKRLTLRFDNNYNNCGLEDQSLDSLRSYPRLKRLDLTICVAIDYLFLDPLKLCHGLTHLSLNWSQMNIIDNVCEDLLARSLKLKSIEIRRNNVSKFYCQSERQRDSDSQVDQQNDKHHNQEV